MTNRRTSVYTIRLTNPRDVDGVASDLREAGVSIVDHGVSSVSFRSTDDDTARQTVDHALYGRFLTDYIITTSLGVHRRIVVEA